jgi:tRNA(Ile)-lysidine synthase
MAALFETIDAFIQANNLLPNNCSVIVGLSGGPDSVFLLHLLAEYKKKGIISQLIAAHLDHEWRKNSAQDLLFCKKLCKQLGVPFVGKKASQIKMQAKKTGSKEEYGRILRRLFFENVRGKYDADCIALAHHLQDQEENFFIRLIRGTTLTGLVGMKAKEGLYIRPLLEVNKQDIVAYLESKKIDYVIDPSNVDESYLRNRIRKHVLPALAKSDARFDQNFLRTHKHLLAADNFIKAAIDRVYESLLIKKDARMGLNFKQLLKLDSFQQYHVLRQWLIAHKIPFVLTESFLDEIVRFLKQTKSTRHAMHEHWAIVKDKDMIFIEKQTGSL